MRIAGTIRRAVLLAAFSLFFAHVLNADAVPLKTFESNVILNADGSALVVENIELLLAAGSFDREIRTHYPGVLGNTHLHIDIAEVSDGNGKELAFYTLQSSNALTIRIPRLAGRTLKIIYGVPNAAVFAGDHDEFFWIANNSGASVEAASLKLTLPATAAAQFRSQSFLRLENEIDSRTALWSDSGLVPTQITGTEIYAGAPGPLASGVVMIMDAFLPKGILTPPHAAIRAWWYLRANPIVFLPLGALLVALVLRRLKPPAGSVHSIAPMYEPPPGLTPAEVGILVDDSVDPRDICATLIDLAVRGYVRLEETKPDEGITSSGPDYIVRLLKPQAEWAALAPHERTMLFHTFYGGQWTKLSSLRLRFPDIVPYVKADLLHTLKHKHFYRVDPESAQAWRLGAMFAVVALLLFAQALGIVSLGDSFLLGFISLACSMFLVYWLGRGVTAKTRRGIKAWVAIRGFEEFLRSVDGDRLQRMEPGIFERHLPYAMALGIEHRWTRAFEGIAIAKPDWLSLNEAMLRGSDAGLVAKLIDPVSLGHQLDLMFHQAILTAPRGRMAGLAAADIAHTNGLHLSATQGS